MLKAISWLVLFSLSAFLWHAKSFSASETICAQDAYAALGIKPYTKTLLWILSYIIDLEQTFSDQYDYLRDHSPLLNQSGFFTSDESQKKQLLKHQIPFLMDFFRGKLTFAQLSKFQNAHFNNRINTITHQHMDELLTLVSRKFSADHPLLAYIYDPRTFLKTFHPYIVKEQ